MTKKLFFILCIIFFTTNLFAADIIITKKRFAEPLDQGTGNSDLQDLTGIGWNFFGNFWDRDLGGDWKLDLGVLSNIIIGISTGEKKVKGTVTFSKEFLQDEVFKDDAGEGTPLRAILDDLGDRSADIDETIPEILAGFDIDFGLKLTLGYKNFLKPYVAAGSYTSLINYAAADLGTEADAPINAITENTSIAGIWYAYGISVEAKNIIRIALENKVNTAPNRDFVSDNIDLSSRETKLIFNIGF